MTEDRGLAALKVALDEALSAADNEWTVAELADLILAAMPGWRLVPAEACNAPDTYRYEAQDCSPAASGALVDVPNVRSAGGEGRLSDSVLEAPSRAVAPASAVPVDAERLIATLRQAYTLLVSVEPTLHRDAMSAPNGTSAHYKRLLIDKVKEWVDPFREDFDAGLAVLATPPSEP